MLLRDSAPDLTLRDLRPETLVILRKSRSKESCDVAKARSAAGIAELLEVLGSVLAVSEVLSDLHSLLQLRQSNPERPAARMFERLGPSDPDTGLPRFLVENVAKLDSRLQTLKSVLEGHKTAR